MRPNLMKLALIIGVFQIFLYAEEWDFLTVNGYGTLGVAFQDDKSMLVRNSPHTKNGTRGDVSFTNYSNLGLQLDAHVTDDLRFTLQAIASDNNSHAKLLEIGWADARYQVTDNLSIKAGVMRVPTFMYSDILNVAYYYEWVKLPEMYALIPFHNYIGTELNYDFDFDDVFIHTTLMYGKSKGVMVDTNGMESRLTVDNMKGVSLKFLYENFMLRVAFIRNSLNAEDEYLDSLSSQLASFNIPVITQTLEQYMPDEVDYFQIGAQYDFQKLYLLGEYMKTSSKSFLANYRSWYVGTGYHFNKWSPYLLFSQTRSSSSYKDIPINNGMSQQEIGSIISANNIFHLLSTINSIESETKSIGVRYNVSDEIVLKVQYDHQKEINGQNVGFNYGGDKNVDYDLYSTSINFVF
jgi:hypothetical protein